MEFIHNGFQKEIGIYGIKNLVNDKIYVGQTSQSFQRRYWNHRWKLNSNIHDNIYLQKDWNKYGSDKFEFVILYVITKDESIDELEKKFIAQYRNTKKCYNILDGGYCGGKGRKLSEEHKKRIGIKNRQHMLGKKASDKTKQKMSDIRKGKYVKRKNDTIPPELIIPIKQALVKNIKPSEVAKMYDVDYKAINRIISNNAWHMFEVDGWDEFLANRKTYHRMSKDDHKEIARLHREEGYTKQHLAQIYNRGVDYIAKIIKNN